MMRVVLLLFWSSWWTAFDIAGAFTSTSHRGRVRTSSSSSSSSLAVVVDDGTMTTMLTPFANDGAVMVAVAVTSSFAAGALTQVPRVRALERNVTDTVTATAVRVADLEARLHALDAEYEQGTQALRERFEEMRGAQLKKQARRLAEEYQYKMRAQMNELTESHERRLQEQRSELLTQQLERMNDVTGDRQTELMTLRMRQSQLQERNEKLATLLAESEEKLTELQQQQRRGTGWIASWFGGGSGGNRAAGNENESSSSSPQQQALEP